MSDHEERISDVGYDTPVPELDDHRHRSSSHRNDRARRGTVDTLYGARNLDLDNPYLSGEVRVRDFEEAVVDDDEAVVSPMPPRSRRPTVDSTHNQRAASPPNSVKAFAEARRRERTYSVQVDDDSERGSEDNGHHRTYSTGSSHRSLRTGKSKAPTAAEDDAGSILSNKTAEEDVCFPVQDEHRRDKLYIDFDYLENFIAAENATRQEVLESQGPARVFPSMGADSAAPSTAPMVTLDGDFIHQPNGSSSSSDEKAAAEAAERERERVEAMKEHIDHNRFSFFSSAWESTIHAAEFGDLVLPGEDVRGLFTFPRDEPDGVWWLNVNRPTEEEVRTICKAFGVHPLTIEDITAQETREKIEIFPAYYFACFRSFNVVQEEDGPDYEPFNTYVVVFREGTLSFSFEPNAHASDVRKRITMLKDYVSLSSDWICYALIDNIVDSFAPAISRIERVTEGIEDSVFVARTDDTNQFLRRIGLVRKNTLGLMRLLGGKADVLKGFTKRCNENYKVTPRMDIGMYLGDIQDHVVTMMTNLGHFEKILSRAHSNYLAQLTIDSITQGTKTNQGLSKITFLASVIVPLNVITGLFGMNVTVPWGSAQGDGNLNPFGGIVATMVAFVLVCVIIARRLRYI